MWMAFPEYFVCRKTKPCKTSWLRKCRNILSRIWGGTEHQNVVFFVRPPSGYIIIQITEWYSKAICEICVQGNVENISMGVSKFQYFSTVPLCDVDGCVCLKRGGSSHFFALSCQHSQFLMVKVTAEWYCKNFFRNRYAQQGLINKRLNKVCDSFKMLCSNCLNHWEYLLWGKGLGTKLGKLSFTF